MISYVFASVGSKGAKLLLAVPTAAETAQSFRPAGERWAGEKPILGSHERHAKPKWHRLPPEPSTPMR